ncbi:MAG: NUDIX domain-containing protein [Firmicutes bacterium]|nr:NUDIX domain-containing protein [Bacillota bacterium]
MKPPSGKGRRVDCQDLSGRVQSYNAEELRFRPAAYGMLVRDGTILLARSRFTGLWDFPGGGVEAFESLAEGMAREFFEETGFHVRAESLVYVAEGFIAMFGHPYHSLRFYYRCSPVDGVAEALQPDVNEVAELRWWPLDGIPRTQMHTHDVQAFQHLVNA